jgi:hypothetical protein
MYKITLTFECGCFVMYWADSDMLGENYKKPRLQGGLSCCIQHEAAHQRLENILPLTLVRVTGGGSAKVSQEASSN